jgi:GTPase SAR1 family protein
VIKTELDDLIVGIELLPTAGSDEYARLRPLCYPGAEIFLLFFSVADRASFDAIKPKWVQELHTCDSVPPNVPYLLVGSQTNLRDDNPDPEALKNGHLVSHGEGEELARQIGALKYLECSARKERGLKEIMQEAARIVLQRRENNPSEKKKDKDRCIIQ